MHTICLNSNLIQCFLCRVFFPCSVLDFLCALVITFELWRTQTQQQQLKAELESSKSTSPPAPSPPTSSAAAAAVAAHANASPASADSDAASAAVGTKASTKAKTSKAATSKASCTLKATTSKCRPKVAKACTVTKDGQTVLKPVECVVCQRRFKNTPALNGHMRLHGGFIKRDETKKPTEKKDTTGKPLQTASVGVRALIGEKIIQKRGRDLKVIWRFTTAGLDVLHSNYLPLYSAHLQSAHIHTFYPVFCADSTIVLTGTFFSTQQHEHTSTFVASLKIHFLPSCRFQLVSLFSPAFLIFNVYRRHRMAKSTRMVKAP